MSEKISEKAQTEARAQAPSSGGLSDFAMEILGRVKPYHVWVAHKLRQEIQYRVGGYKIYARPGELAIHEHGYTWLIREQGPELETPSFHYTSEPEPSLADVLDYWAGVARFMAEHLAEDMAEILKEAVSE